tara:strand:- start:11014 stop:11337 length:324 start_codon:yes stop_codon:yes gene_type:complete
MKKYRFVGNEFINVQRMYRWAMNCDSETFEVSAKDEAAKLWILADLLPSVPASTLLRIIQAPKESVREEEDDTGAALVFDTRSEKIKVHFADEDRITITVEDLGGEE